MPKVNRWFGLQCLGFLANIYTVFGKGFEILQVFHGLLGKCRFHEKAHYFHKQRRKLKLVFADPFSAVGADLNKTIVNDVENPGAS